jgi:hypothetical protein
MKIKIVIGFLLLALLVACTGVNSGTDTTSTAILEQTSSPTVTQTQDLTTTATSTPDLTTTATDSSVMVTVLENSNCRTGEAAFFKFVVLLTKGEVVEAVGVNSRQSYFYVHVPNSTPQYCWVWYYHVAVTGEVSSLPVFTPQPTPLRTMSPTPTRTFTPTSTPTITLTSTITLTPTKTQTPTITQIPSQTPTPGATSTSGVTPTNTLLAPTETPTIESSPTATPA